MKHSLDNVDSQAPAYLSLCVAAMMMKSLTGVPRCV